MPSRDLQAYLFDVDEECRLVMEFTSGSSAEAYAGDSLLRSAVERRLEIIDEALSAMCRRSAAR